MKVRCSVDIKTSLWNNHSEVLRINSMNLNRLDRHQQKWEEKIMSQQVSAILHFAQGFDGQLQLREGEVAIGAQADQARPYDLLQGALAACLHSTFLGILEKKRITIDFADYLIEGIKRETVPTMLESVKVRVRIPDGLQNEAIEKSMVLATQYCSVYNTLASVAKMECVVEFVKSE